MHPFIPTNNNLCIFIPTYTYTLTFTHRGATINHYRALMMIRSLLVIQAKPLRWYILKFKYFCKLSYGLLHIRECRQFPLLNCIVFVEKTRRIILSFNLCKAEINRPPDWCVAPWQLLDVVPYSNNPTHGQNNCLSCSQVQVPKKPKNNILRHWSSPDLRCLNVLFFCISRESVTPEKGICTLSELTFKSMIDVRLAVLTLLWDSRDLYTWALRSVMNNDQSLPCLCAFAIV